MAHEESAGSFRGYAGDGVIEGAALGAARQTEAIRKAGRLERVVHGQQQLVKMLCELTARTHALADRLGGPSREVAGQANTLREEARPVGPDCARRLELGVERIMEQLAHLSSEIARLDDL